MYLYRVWLVIFYIPSQNLYPHKNYRSLEKYDDIAIIELQRDVEYSSLVFPICLHTDSVDPPSNAVLNVTGWGATSVQSWLPNFGCIIIEVSLN